ncbi:hypothetical protein ACVIGB_001082 [Bradyrhizobium sp. USDA 4341]
MDLHQAVGGKDRRVPSPHAGDHRGKFLSHVAHAEFLPRVIEFVDAEGGPSAWIGREAQAIHKASYTMGALHHLDSEYGLYLAEVLHETLKDRGAPSDRPFKPHRPRHSSWRHLAKPFRSVA